MNDSLLSALRIFEHLRHHSPALSDGDKRGANQTISYAQLAKAVTDTAAVIRAYGPQAVALYADNSPQWLLVDFACQALQIPFVPLPLYFSEQQIQHALKTCAADLLLTDQPARTQMWWPQTAVEEQSIAGFAVLNKPVKQLPILPQGTHKITFTSGTTGEPKGVCLNNANQLRVAQALFSQIGIRGGKHLCILPLTTLLENIAGVYAPLMAGAEVLVPPLADVGFNGSSRFDIKRFLQTLTLHQPSSIILLPQLLSALVAAIDRGYTVPASLRFIAVGGARVSPALLAKAARLGLPVYEGYGLSECASVVSLNRPGENHLGSAGKLLPHLSARLDHGELVVTGNSFLGYAGNPDSWYPERVHTGDLAEIRPDGFLNLSGRKKNLLISSFGRNISPEWVESELTANPSIASALVVGDAQPFCAALLFIHQQAPASQALDAWVNTVNAQLPDYATVRSWHCIPYSQLLEHGLISANGRLKRECTEHQFAQQIAEFYQTPAVGAHA